MKKGLLIAAGISLLIISVVIYALTDVDKHWAKSYIDYLVEKQAIAGYPDGSFKPENKISTAEFSKILVAALGHDMGNAPTGHWAEQYMNQAKTLGLILAGETEFNDYDANINRGMMARMIARAMTEQYDDLSLYLNQIKDYSALKSANQDAVLTVFRAGIVTGYPDGSFKDLNSATRAEASTILARFLNRELRVVPEIVVDPFEGLDLSELVEMPSGAEFHESTNPQLLEFYSNINLLDPLEPQYRDLELFLKRWLDQESINKIMIIVKSKTTRESDEIYELIPYNGKFVIASAVMNSYIIEVKGFIEQ